ncbi:hypothetical protein ACROYT_G011249 [Oculina patagonica]
MAEKIIHEERSAGTVVSRVENDFHIDPTSVSRSIFVTGFQATTKSEDLLIHFQRKKNGGGDIDSVIISKRGAAVITFDSPEVVKSVVQREQEFQGVALIVKPYEETMTKEDHNFEVFELVSAELCLETVELLTREQTITLLKEIAGKTGIEWIDSSECFIMPGAFKQVEMSRTYLQQALNQTSPIHRFVPDDLVEIESAQKLLQDVYQGRHSFPQQSTGGNETFQYGDTTQTQQNSSQILDTAASFEAGSRVGEELRQARSACSELERRLRNELAQIRQTLDNEVRLRNVREQELREKETVVDKLKKTLGGEQQARARVEQELRQELQKKKNAIREQQRRLKYEHQQKTVLEERLRNFQLQIVEERSRHASTERELESALSAAQEELAEYKQSQPELRQKLQVKENEFREQQRRLEDEHQQRTVVEERLSNFQLQIEEERNRHASTERELESGLATAQEALAEYQRSQQELSQELQVKENAIREKQRHLEDEHQQRTVVEERLRNFQLQIEEERNRHASTERELSAAQEALAEYQRRQPPIRSFIRKLHNPQTPDNNIMKGVSLADLTSKRMEGLECWLEKDDIIIDKSNASRSISVSGFPSKTTANELVIHFQKRKHGGGNIERIHITDNGVAVIVFDESAGPAIDS